MRKGKLMLRYCIAIFMAVASQQACADDLPYGPMASSTCLSADSAKTAMAQKRDLKLALRQVGITSIVKICVVRKQRRDIILADDGLHISPELFAADEAHVKIISLLMLSGVGDTPAAKPVVDLYAPENIIDIRHRGGRDNTIEAHAFSTHAQEQEAQESNAIRRAKLSAFRATQNVRHIEQRLRDRGMAKSFDLDGFLRSQCQNMVSNCVSITASAISAPPP